jgi:hypothetical protein
MQDHQGSQLPETFSDLLRAAQIMKDFPRSWCVCGGWAIDLFINRLTRPHKDVDFAIWRRDQLALHAYLTAQGWSLEKAVDGQLMPWPEGEFIELPIHTIWCKHRDLQPDFCEVLLNEANAHLFSFRHDLSITRSLEATTIRLESGIPILAPEIVLLYKANNITQEGNRSDFESTLPLLEAERRTWLRNALATMHPGHEWLSQL